MYKPKFFFNVSNHPSTAWSDAQRSAALEIGQEIVDFAHPNIPPTATHLEVYDMADEVFNKIYMHGAAYDNGAAVHIAGEPTFVASFLRIAEEYGIPCYTATTERIVNEVQLEFGVTRKETIFKFCQFRPLVR